MAALLVSVVGGVCGVRRSDRLGQSFPTPQVSPTILSIYKTHYKNVQYSTEKNYKKKKKNAA